MDNLHDVARVTWIDDVAADGDQPAARNLLLDLEREVEAEGLRLQGLGLSCRGFVSSELSAVHAALASVLERDLARGLVFCEWGCGMGAICALAASLGYEAHGIEIQAELVDIARELLTRFDLEAGIAHGTYLLPGHEDILPDCPHTDAASSRTAYQELGLNPDGCDVVFAYPWPGEEAMHDVVFVRQATEGALLLTYHDGSRVLIQRHRGPDRELESLGWVDASGR